MLLAAGKLAGAGCSKVSQARQLQQRIDPVGGFASRDPFEAIANVAFNRHVREQRQILKDQTNTAPLRVDGQAGRADFALADVNAAVGHIHEACNGTKQRGLAAAAGPHQRQPPAILYAQRQVLEHRMVRAVAG